MSDLYDRLEEIQGMTRVLSADVDGLRAQLGSRSIADSKSAEEEGARRAYVRAVFALIEAIVEQHKRLLLDLATRQAVTLEPAAQAVLVEQTYVVSDNGMVSTREQYLQLRRKIRLVYRAAADALGQPFAVRYDDQGWHLFGEAIEIRDRLTHPKSYADCDVGDDDLGTLDQGHEWFRALNNEFVRVARGHRQVHGW